MSQADQEQYKSMDKKEIADEEREKMLNAENTKHTSAAPATEQTESEEQKPKKKIPIGGIKMPGFCRTRSKEPCKDEDETTKTAESAEAESAPAAAKENDQNAAPVEKPITPAKDTKEKEGRRGRILSAIRFPSVSVSSVFSRKKKEADSELGQTGAAGLASVETLDDSAGELKPIVNEDGMETVRLDGEDGADGAAPGPKYPLICITTLRKHMFVSVATVLILLCVIIIICIACVGPRRVPVQLLKNGKYIDTVTSCGPVQGILEDGGYAFRGIPYAMPPVDNRRWQHAQALSRIERCWNGTYLAYNTSESCVQSKYGQPPRRHGSEDCLYLDVFTPAVRYDTPLPVVVMIGAETLSSGSPGVMQPSAKLARVRDIVFVRPNFRLGIFGFLAAEPLSRATHPPTSGNYGLSDIIVALQWVQLNIEHFGGNKSSVTLWGHRAGGTLVTTLINSRRTKNLFSRLWISSGSAIFPGDELSKSEAENKLFLHHIHCNDAACLKSKSVDDILNAVPETWYREDSLSLPKMTENDEHTEKHQWLVLDGAILQDHVGAILNTQEKLSVKVVMGTTAQASVTEPLHLQSNIDRNTTQVRTALDSSYLKTLSSNVTNEAIRRYNSTLRGLFTMISDIRVVCPLLTVARIRDDIPFYVATQPRERLADPDSDAAAILGSYIANTPEKKRYVSAMQQLFNHYVWHGEVAQADPSGAKRILVVGQDTLLEHDYPNCDFWIKNNIVPRFGRID